MKLKRLITLLLAPVMAVVLAATPVMAQHPALNASEALVRDLLWSHTAQNQPWVAHSLSIEAVDRANEIRAQYQANGTYDHSGAFNEITGCWDEVGEILAHSNLNPDYFDYQFSAAYVVDLWHDSPGHEAIMHGDWDYFGIGVVMIAGNPNLRFYAVVWGNLGPPCNVGD